jgi:hypothetical protein
VNPQYGPKLYAVWRILGRPRILAFMNDPYQPPTSDITRQGQSATLYSLQGVVVGTVLGSLAAAVVILCLNYLNLGSPGLAKKTALLGTVVYLLVIGFTALLPESMLIGIIMILVQAALGYLLANQLQGTAIRYHMAHGGKLHSNIRAAGMGLLTGFAIMFLVVFAVTVFQLGVPGALELPA